MRPRRRHVPTTVFSFDNTLLFLIPRACDFLLSHENGCCRWRGHSRPNNCPIPWQRPFPFRYPLLFVIPSVGEGSAVSLSSATEVKEENCRSLGLARG